MFNDASQFIQGASATVLDIAATDEIELTATLIDVVGNLAVSGTIIGAGALTAATSITVGSAVLTEAELETLDGITVGTAIASKVVTTDANIDTSGQRNLTITGELDAATGDFSGDVDIDGTANLDVVDIDGATQIDATVTVGVNGTGYDVQFFGDTTGSNLLWDQSADDLILAGAAGLILPDGKLTLGSTAVTSTAAELNLLDGVSGLVQADLTKLAAIDATAAEINLIDGGTSTGTTAVADADGIITNDGGTMRLTTAATFKTYFQEGISTAYDDLTTGDAAVTIDTTSGNITVDSNAGLVSIDGHTGVTLASSNSGDITLDSVADINLDAGGADIVLKDDGTTYGSLTNTSGNLIIKSGTTTAATFAGANVTFAGTVGSGAITSSGIVTGTAFTAGSAVLAEAELELLDGLTAGTAIASKVVTTDASIDTTGQRNLTISGELDAATLDISGAIDIAGASVLHGLLTQDGGAVFNEGSADVDFRVETNGDTHAFFVDAGDGYVSINGGVSSPQLRALPGGESNGLQIKGNSASSASMAITRHTADAAAPALRFLKSRNTTVNSYTIVNNNDILGSLEFYGDDGTNYDTPGASITAKVNGTPGANDMPSQLIFSTTEDGDASVSERYIIKNDGRVEFTKGEISLSSQTLATSTSWNFDNTTASVIALASGASVVIGNCNVSGAFIINETSQTGAVAIVISGGGTLEIVEQTSTFFEGTTSPGTNKLGLYIASGKIYAKSNHSGALGLSLFTFRTRSSA